MDNIITCPSCKRRIISEELESHVCKGWLREYKIIGKTLWLFDGKIWCPLRLRTTKRQQPFRTPKGDTEPIIMLFCT
ncbi:MAG TPA: hypothetical protein VD699_06680 [Nitrosopumilaceae archaeon]|nr:hypothetical protein [Nitrosopumilaceae archaeon]